MEPSPAMQYLEAAQHLPMCAHYRNPPRCTCGLDYLRMLMEGIYDLPKTEMRRSIE